MIGCRAEALTCLVTEKVGNRTNIFNTQSGN